MTAAVDEALRDAADRLGHTGFVAGDVGPELPPAEPQREQGRDEVDGGRRTENGEIGVGQQLHSRTGAAADEEGGRAGRRGDRVGHHQLVGVDNVRQSRGQPGEQEPVHPEGEQHSQVERETSVAKSNDCADDQHQDGAGDVGAEQDLPPRPPVEQHAGERPEHRVRQQSHREQPRNRRRIRRPLRREQHVRRQRDLEHTVAELRAEPDGEQPPEVTPPQQPAQIPDELHACTVATTIRTAGGPVLLGQSSH
jgi:hypothetical protein